MRALDLLPKEEKSAMPPRGTNHAIPRQTILSAVNSHKSDHTVFTHVPLLAIMCSYIQSTSDPGRFETDFLVRVLDHPPEGEQ